ncbi:hypothetical protein LTR36_002600 [Oleoguttula mirabilis]|uniref:Hypervirulence associated protein TUDOR domain-containing protein n=1 Tax=Oleoguttula mirabilis TaxID=1507867 RepID=A0AAV9JK20_9PEZI|nr:hypothetical protein LTR36_002600 [Oleoguttula mirabilis]
MPPKDKYSDPELRNEVKEEIHESDKGGAPGQWSARKAQMMAQEYKRRGGGYNTDKSEQDESQKNLSKWGEEDWQTKEGSGNAKQEDGTEKRYLPKKAWEQMTEEEKEETDDKKLQESKEGKQYVGNTSKAKESRQKANDEESEKYEATKAQEEQQQDGESDAEADGSVDGAQEEVDEDAAYDNDSGVGDDQSDDPDAEHEDEEVEEENSSAQAGEKRKGDQEESNGASKKQKQGNAPAGKVGSKHMDDSEPAPRGSADRLPKKGQAISWKAMPGYVNGEVTEVLTSRKKVDGKDVKASESDPRIVMKSASSGKVCVHKAEACFYEDV